ALQLLHEVRQDAVRCVDDGVEVIAHGAAGEKVDTVPLFFTEKNPKEPPAIAVVLIDSLLPVPTIHDVVRCSTNKETRISAHGRRLIQSCCRGRLGRYPSEILEMA